MQYLPTEAKILADYQTSCFCSFEGQLPQFPAGEPFRTEPRFNFKHEARQYAGKHGLEIISWGKYQTAIARLAIPCSHRPEQFVRLYWNLT